MRTIITTCIGAFVFIAALLSPLCVDARLTAAQSVDDPKSRPPITTPDLQIVNNDPATTFADIQEVLRITESLIALRLKGSPHKAALSQKQNEDTCDDPIYEIKDVTQRAKIKRLKAPSYTEEARANRVEGTVVLTAVLCRNGKVTNIEVVKALPHGLTENTIETTRHIEFEPAEKNGEIVSQRLRRECTFRLF